LRDATVPSIIGENGVVAMEFVPIDASHFPRMAKIHAESMSGSFLPSLGKRFLDELYPAMFGSGAARGAVALDDGKVVAFCYYTTDEPSFFQRTLRSSTWRLALWAAVGLVRRPYLIRSLMETVRYRGITDISGVSAEFYAWAVDPAWRGRGVGWRVYDAAEEMMRSEGTCIYKHTVYEDNVHAIELYRQRGNEPVGRFELYGRRWVLYRVDLASRSKRS